MPAFEDRFGLAERAGISNRLARALGVEGFQSSLDAHLLAGRLVGYVPLGLDGEVPISAIRPFDQPDPLDLRQGEGLKAALLADQFQASNPHAEGVG